MDVIIVVVVSWLSHKTLHRKVFSFFLSLSPLFEEKTFLIASLLSDLLVPNEIKRNAKVHFYIFGFSKEKKFTFWKYEYKLLRMINKIFKSIKSFLFKSFILWIYLILFFAFFVSWELSWFSFVHISTSLSNNLRYLY